MNKYELDIIRNRNKELHINVGIHSYDFETRSNKHDNHRICFYLRRADRTFIDSFDIDYFEGKIRFYGSTKHYSVNKVPKYIKKLWRCDDFKSMIIDALDNNILLHKEHSLMYDLLVDTKLSIMNSASNYKVEK